MLSCHDVPFERGTGLLVQLYSVRDERDLGAGDFGTLRALIDWAAELQIDFVGLNPLHALDLAGFEPCPYSPSSRLYLHALYLELDAVPELAQCADARRLVDSEWFREEASRTRAASLVDHGAVLRLKLEAMRLMHQKFIALHSGDTPRSAAYRAFLAREGARLTDFSRYAAVAEYFGVWDFRLWPEPYRDSRSAHVTAFARARPDAVAFHSYLQFELDRQLQTVAEHAAERGLRLGLYLDLALGSVPGGAEVWAQPDAFAHDASLGAPPDDYAADGQVWGLAPMLPSAWETEGGPLFDALLERTMRHAGAMRLDHAMGVRRQFWVPHGTPGTHGGYVPYPEGAMLDALAQASQHHRCAVVGEDLGTVPAGFREMMRERSILRSLVLYFERDGQGEFAPPGHYAREALASVNTHDLPTLVGFWEERDLEQQRQRGASEASLVLAAQERARSRAQLLQRLRAEGVLGHDPASPDTSALCRAVHELLARVPSQLFGISLDDLAGEPLAVNLPGSPDPQRQNWRRRLGRSLTELREDEQLDQWLRELVARRTDR